MVLPLELLGQSHKPQDGTYLVKITEANCDPTRRVRCHYEFESVSEDFSVNKVEEKKTFGFLFYLGADQIEEQGKKVDALTRVEKFFEITGNRYGSLLGENLSINYKEPVKLEILGSRYKFTRKDGKTIEVDIEKKTTP